MAISFDESDDYFVITDHASLTLPDGNWCVGIWLRLTDNAGSSFQYAFSNGGWGANNTINLNMTEESNGGSYDDKHQASVEDGDGTSITLHPTNATGQSTAWNLVIIQRDTGANEVQIWYCAPGGTPNKEDSEADTNLGAINGGDWNLARRTDGDADRYWGGELAEFFKGDFCLSLEEITALGAGIPIWALGHTLDAYLPMWESVTTLKDLFGGNNGARQSSPTTVEHAPVRLATGPTLVQVVAAAAAAAAALPVISGGEIHSLVFGRVTVR